MSDVVLGERDEAAVGVGDTVTVRLPENGSTGYVWTVQSCESGLAVEQDESHPPGLAAPGAAGERVIRVAAREPGSWHLRLRLARSWEQGALAERDITVEVS